VIIAHTPSRATSRPQEWACSWSVLIMRLGCDNSVALGFTAVGDQFVGALVGVVDHRLAHGDALGFLLPTGTRAAQP